MKENTYRVSPGKGKAVVFDKRTSVEGDCVNEMQVDVVPCGQFSRFYSDMS